MISLDTRLSPSFRYYDAQIKWLAPGGLTVSELADALYVQWQKHAPIKQRYGIPVTPQAALEAILLYLRAVFNESIPGIALPASVRALPARKPEPPKARRCCGGRV